MSLLLDVVAVKLIVRPDVQLAVVDDGVLPAGAARPLGELKLALETIAVGRRVDEGHRVVLVAEVEATISVQHRRRAAAGTLANGPPHEAAGLQLEAKREALAVV